MRREGCMYVCMYVLNRIINSKKLFWYLNRRNIIIDAKNPFFSSVAIYSYTSLKQIQSLIKSMPDDSSVILMFHSILRKSDIGYNHDKWFWDEDKFKDLLDLLSNEKNINICTNRDLLNH